MFFCKRNAQDAAKTAGKPYVEAAIANGALVVSYLNGDHPRIWRGSMALASTAALELQEGDGKFRLLMKVPGAPDEEVLVLNDRDSALAAFQAITAALMAGPATGGVVIAKPQGSLLGRFFKFVLWVFVLIVILLSIVNIVGNRVQLQGGLPTGPKMTLAPGMKGPPAAPAVKTGTPMPADELFGN